MCFACPNAIVFTDHLPRILAYRDILRRHENEMTPTQFAAMVRLLEEGECSQNELGRRTAMDVATIKGVVDRLRSKGLVALNPDPNDKRRTTISAAGPAGDLRAALHDMGRRITAKTLAPLTPTERKTLLRLLSKLT